MAKFSAKAEQFFQQAARAEVEVERMKKELVEKYVAQGYEVQVEQDMVTVGDKKHG